MTKKAIIYVPGLKDRNFFNRNIIKLLALFWTAQEFELFLIQINWRKGNKFAPKLKLIKDKIDELSTSGYSVHLFGQSAGASAALNASVERKNIVRRVINICGRLRKGENVFPSLKLAAKGNPAFEESVLLFENQNEKRLTHDDRKKILTVRPIWDEIVPASTVTLNGATNIQLPLLEHSLGGIFALTLFSSKLKTFLK